MSTKPQTVLSPLLWRPVTQGGRPELWPSVQQAAKKRERRDRWQDRKDADKLARVVRHQQENEELKKEMGTWLGQLAPWDVFSTWTFSRLVQASGAMYWARRHLRYLEKSAEQPIYAFTGAERGRSGGLIHVHALVGNVAHLKTYCGQRLAPGAWARNCCQLHAWPCGIARVRPYDPALGAAHYVAKYISKKLAEWELVGFPGTPQKILELARPQSSRRRGGKNNA